MTLALDQPRSARAPDPERLQALPAVRSGQAILPGDPAYDEARRIYNRMHDPQPLALVRSLDPGMLAETIAACASDGIPLALRGGGHHIGSSSGGDGGVVLDFSGFRQVDLSAATGICQVQPGARLGDLDRELARAGRVVPSGTVSDTGIAGLAMGGGIGWLLGTLGLTCDHLVGADLLMPDGRVVRAEEPDHSEALWALRGGGGAGVALALRFRTVPLPQTHSGSALVDDAAAPSALLRLLDYLRDRCPRELTVAPLLTRIPDGSVLLRVDYCCTGRDPAAVDALLAALGPCRHQPFAGSFAAWQSNFDGHFLPPQRGYWKSCHVADLGPGQIRSMVEAVRIAPSPRSSILIEHLHGAFRDGDPAASAFPLREARFGILIAAQWPDPANDARAVAWVRECYARLDPAGILPVYANYAEPGDRRAGASFGAERQARLLAVRGTYDPPGLARRPGSAPLAPSRNASP